MDLSGITQHLRSSRAFEALRAAIPAKGSLRIGVTEGAKAVVIAALMEETRRPIVVVTTRPHAAQTLVEEISAWLGGAVPVQLFPERELLPYHLTSPDSQLLQQRLQLLEQIETRKPQVIVACAIAVAQPTSGGPGGGRETEVLRKGSRIDPTALFERLSGWGYEFGQFVEQPGEAARRGGIVDVFPASAEAPVRLELWGNDIDSMRTFDPLTQRSLDPVEELTIGPAVETLPDRDAVARLAAGLNWESVRSDLREKLEPALDALAAGELPSRESLAFFGPLLSRHTLFDHLPEDALVLMDEPDEVRQTLGELEEQASEIGTEMATAGELPAGLPLPFLPANAFMERIRALPRRIEISRWVVEDDPSAVKLPFHAPPSFGGRLRAMVDQVAAPADERYVIVTQQAPRLSELFADQDLPSAVVESVQELAPGTTLVHGALPHGWRLTDETGALTILSDAEIFGFVKQRRVTRPSSQGRRTFLGDLAPGDYVVHIEHGIAKFAGMVRRTINDVEREYLELRYAENDRLFVPSEQIDRVSRYVGPSDHMPHLTRLDSGDWARAKERVRRAVTDLAKELIELYAAREVAQGHAFAADGGWQMEMEAAFPYVETPDQLAAIRDVKGDMERTRPMDRLICGDVGYGKTEVAVRAAFKAVVDGKQVAVLVPTTVLAQQHEKTFKERLSGFPMRVESLSRFRSEREQRDVVAKLETGEVDIVIGTHRLLQKDVRFKDLGLVIIDEEQRFGVAHKERLKHMRREVDVLTLSATPIPRTLHLSLGGIRDMSVMDTPPEDRLPVRTYVTEFDDLLVREAILREVDRGGQVYFVHNRVQDITLLYRRLSDLVPEARFSVGHGQMPEEELERVMLEFATGESDVLICTTIIESGLDIPNVNTIIIDHADRLGLAQLYQLRGRVGRGANRAYAYLLYDRNRVLTETAQKRLQTIFEATELGAGFQIALRDLEIRGAGNLLGSEQSGHIGAVGFDLYTRLLSDAVERLRAMLKGETPPLPKAEQTAFAVDLPLTAFVPERYIVDLDQRLSVYQRLTSSSTVEEIDQMAAELRDRFGPVPGPVRNLLYIVRLRALGRSAGVQSIASEGEVVIVQLAD